MVFCSDFLSTSSDLSHLLPTLLTFKFHPLFWITKHAPTILMDMNISRRREGGGTSDPEVSPPQVPISLIRPSRATFSTPKTGWQWRWKKGLVTSHIQPSPVGLWRETRCSKAGPALSDSPYYRGPDCREQQSNIASNVGVDGSCLDYTMWVASRSLQFKTQFWVCPTFQMLLNGEVTGSNISIKNNRK